jgi:hypothetical protein
MFTSVLVGIQKVPLSVRIFVDLCTKAGYSGTWGPGLNRMNVVHIKDAANACLVVFKAALEGKAEEGAEGLCMFIYCDSEILLLNEGTR